ncbi:undecaprenyl-diphosphatase [Phycisphaerales bacterium]|nr:undecaprenyl-diphosphatase [Phycisphaerales bacterium]
MQLELWQAVVLGVVEGITEYLPISSTGHLILASGLMGLDSPDRREAVNSLNIVVQGGAILAVVGLYWPSVLSMLKGVVGRDNAGFRLAVNLFMAFLPAAIFGKLFDDAIDRLLFRPGPVLLALAVGGIYMMILDLRQRGRMAMIRSHLRHKTLADLTITDSLIIGLLQCIAMWPGTSRSMMTITGGMIVGLPPREAAKFSFLLGVPTLTAATLYKLAKNLYSSHQTQTPNMFDQLGWLPCLVGLAVAAISAALAVKWLVNFLSRHGLMLFGWYRLALCAVLLILIQSGLVSIEHPEAVNPNQTQTTVPPVRW